YKFRLCTSKTKNEQLKSLMFISSTNHQRINFFECNKMPEMSPTTDGLSLRYFFNNKSTPSVEVRWLTRVEIFQIKMGGGAPEIREIQEDSGASVKCCSLFTGIYF
ncbi:hypothetical protein WA026_003715, partial [Henosepilachna vigintioctopunctata]